MNIKNLRTHKKINNFFQTFTSQTFHYVCTLGKILFFGKMNTLEKTKKEKKILSIALEV